MSAAEWPGEWIGGDEKMAQDQPDESYTNDHGTRYLVGDSAGEFMWMADVPARFENRC